MRIVSVLALAMVLVAACQSPWPGSAAGRQHLGQANQYLQEGLTDSALASFGLALEENPKLVEAHLGTARLYQERGKYNQAMRSYRRATELEPGSFDAHFGLGLMKQLIGQVHNAVSIYLRALAIDPDSFQANHHLAGAYLQLNRAPEAIAFARRATELNQQDQGTWANLATAYSLTGNHEQAVDAYRRAVELGEPAEPILLGLADSHIRLHRYERAVVVLNNQIRRSAGPIAYERLGYAQFKLRRFDGALDSFRLALSFDQDDTAALNGLGACLMTLYLQSDRAAKSQRDGALAAWRRSIQLRPDQPYIIDLLARYQRS